MQEEPRPGLEVPPSATADPPPELAAPVAFAHSDEHPHPHPTQRDLSADLLAARGGDQLAFAELWRDLNPRLLRYAAVLVAQDAEDVVADAWLQIARDLDRFDGTLPQFRAWTARIVRNRAIDHLRAQARRPQRARGIEALADQASPDDTAVLATDAISTDAALALIATLPRNQAEAVLLRAVVGLDPVSAGKVLGKRPGAVRVAAHRGLRALEQKLQQHDARGEPS